MTQGPLRSEPTILPGTPINGDPVIRYDAAQFVHQLLKPDPRIRTVFVRIRSQGNRAQALRATEYLVKQIAQGTELKVLGNPEEADLVLEGTIQEHWEDRPNPSSDPRP